MSVDKFGRHSRFLKRSRGIRGPPGRGFQLTKMGNYDIENKRLCNVQDSLDVADAVNLKQMRAECLTSENGIFNGKQMVIRNIAPPSENNDVVTKQFLKEYHFPKIIRENKNFHLSFRNKKLEDIANPEEDGDAVNLKYLKGNVYMKTDGSLVLDFKNRRLTNVKTESFDDVITLRLLTNLLYVTYLRGTYDLGRTPKPYADWMREYK